MTDLQQYILMMSKSTGEGVGQKLTIEGDDECTFVSFFQRGMDDEACLCVHKTNQEVTFVFNAADGSFKHVMGAMP
jgi:hypothetical protein